ncbi:uncharacterized protein K460DRAFT_331599 [Cucurbitaria berberidis CBS 394.84]|uniref:RRM domain-containing protein n=1 Tax=Cucurbitaria berberidis CBS 394.84 TaxID=1168544 RepID=A0A9P4LCV2_9PLEO|nr:uncharacterized protein K460DRAFT_331599 [Cucurbitaria berberidis CBS 394.84]KAF1849529.1 hypothetical protein K460DRAFT_331599 [Cucurbitaria berberidis CBS 394.84]
MDNSPHHLFTKAVRSLHTRRNAPPPIPIPINPTSSTIQISNAARPSQNLTWTAVEMSNYPPQLTRRDVHHLFKAFNISPDFTLPNTARLSYPLRTSILVAGKQEAERAAREVSGRVFGGRQIYVKVTEIVEWEQREVFVAKLADELKTGIINTAHVYYPLLASKILEVRELVQGASYSAFLQARDPVTAHSSPEEHMEPMENTAKWEFVAAGRSDDRASTMSDKDGRLSALKNLQQTVESQAALEKIWSEWRGSYVLNLGSDQA